MKENHRLISDSQWRYIHSKLNSLQSQISDLKNTLQSQAIPKRGLRFSECIPPESNCRDILSMLNGTTSYEGFMLRLSAFYDCEPMGIYRDDDVDDKYLAVYRPSQKACYSKGPSVNRKTVLHEWFHHLVHIGVVFLKNKNEEEDLARRYSRIFLTRGGQ